MRGIFRSSTLHTVLRFPGIRYLSLNASHCQLAADKGLLSKLRKQTGIPFIKCKKALQQFDNDFDQAKKWLLEQAQKEGWARATKLQTRPMSQGLIAVMVDQKNTTMLEVNCETDFVARNDKFISMVTKLVHDCNDNFTKQTEKRVDLNRADLEKMPSSEQATLADVVALNVGNLGENMALRRAAFTRASDDSVLCSYVHPSSTSKKPKALMLGKYGAIVEIARVNDSPLSENAISLEDLGSHLCQHIVGMSPKSVGKFSPESKKSSLSNREADATLQDDEKLGDKIESDLTQTQGEDEENQMQSQQEEEEEDELLSQEFLLDSSMTVGELVYLNGVEVKDFIRFACGEELDEERV